jgi:PAS domain S-box-containing protein
MTQLKSYNKGRILSAMGIWLALLVCLFVWIDQAVRNEETRIAFKTANAFFQQIIVSRAWNAGHGGVYVPITADTQPNVYLPAKNRDITADNGLRLTKINPAFMTRQMAELAEKTQGGIRFHVTSLRPIRPENKPSEWEQRWLQSFEQGVKEQGEFFDDGTSTWFRYMAPLVTGRECLSCHAQQGYKEGDVRGGISVALPYAPHSHLPLAIGLGTVGVVGLVIIVVGGLLYERKRLLFNATFNSAIPTCVTSTDYTILMANESYWQEFGKPEDAQGLKCHQHRPGAACHSANCPLEHIKKGVRQYVCEPHKEKEGKIHYYIVTARPMLDVKNEVIGVVESFQDITDRKTLEQDKERLIAELQTSLDKVKLLSGFIPICASCKQIRDDQGYWSQIESYISQHSEAKFSHGICPACVKKLYPEISAEILAKAGQDGSGHQHDDDNFC